MATKKLTTSEMVLIVIRTLTHICGHECELDNAILLELEAGLSQAARSIRSSIRARERGCVAVYADDQE